MRCPKWTFQRQKSISSHAASISAWMALLDCPSIVAAFRVRCRLSRSGEPGAYACCGSLRGSGVATRASMAVLLADLGIDPSLHAVSAHDRVPRTLSTDLAREC